MTDWDLIRRLLDLDLLVAHKFTLLDLEEKLPLNHILDTLLTWAFYPRRKSFAADSLINLKTTSITRINSHLHAWLDITAPGDDTFDLDHSSDRA